MLTAVIPTWNRAHLVCDAIDSALNQDDVEVIVVDDASTDNTAELVTRVYGDRVRLLRLRNRSGAGAARNAGVAIASGEFVGFLDSDDVWLPGKFAAELKVFEEFPNAEAVVSDSQVDGSTRFAQNGLLQATGGEVRWARECDWLWTNSTKTVHTCSITVRRDALTRLGPRLFAEDLACCEDWEFQMRVCHLCRVVVLPRVLAHVRRFDDDSRNGRGIPGRTQTAEQQKILLRDRLTVIKRATWLKDLEAGLAAELERFQIETTDKLHG